MKRSSLPGGVVHQLPADLKTGLLAAPKAHAAWHDITSGCRAIRSSTSAFT